MSINKYAQFFRDSGFFAGSKIKTQVTDGTYIGKEIILSKGTDIIQTMTIPTSGKVEFFTDESGELTLSSDNGSAVITATVTITNYATYNVTMHGMSSDNSREAFANDVTMSGDTASANIAYTGDVSAISIVNSNPNLVRATVSGNKVNLVDGGKDMMGKCSITATVAATDKYDSADVTFYVNKLTGTYGSWGEASDEIITRMIAEADAGDIDLADFWTIGEERRVHLKPIAEGTDVAEQVEQDIDLVILHNPLGDSKYMLTEPTVGNRFQPHFIIGTKDCLEGKSALGYMAKTLTAPYSTSSPNSVSGYLDIETTQTSELLEMLNDNFIEALPAYIQNILKSTQRRYASAGAIVTSAQSGKDAYSTTTMGTRGHKVSIPNIVELGYQCDLSIIMKNYKSLWDSSVGAYVLLNQNSIDHSSTIRNPASDVNNSGTKFAYYNNNSIVKKQGLDGRNIDYFTSGNLMMATDNGSSYKTAVAMCYYINENGNVQTNNVNDVGTRTKLRGISPIMFI